MRTFLLPKPPGALSLVTEIQFGVELEFLTPPVSVSQASQVVPSRDRIFHYFASALQKSGLQAAFLLDEDKSSDNQWDHVEARGSSSSSNDNQDEDEDENEDGQESDNQLRAQAPKGSIVKTKHNPDMYIMNPLSSASWTKAGAKENPLFRYWLVKAESDICGHGKHAAWQPTELNSPILRESEANNLFPGLNTAMYAVWTAHPAKVHVNDSCGLHVHVSPALVPSLAQRRDQGQGQGRKQRLSALQAQRVATLVVVLENNLLFHLCSPIRRRVHHQLAAASSLAHARNTAASPLAEANLPPNMLLGAGTIEKAVKLLWTASDLDQVRQMLSRHAKIRDARFTALQINAHTHEDDGVTNTLEFRHAQASFNQGFVDNWVRLVLTLCKVAFLPAERFKLVVAML